MCPPAIPAIIAIGTMAASAATSIATSKNIEKSQTRAAKAQAEATQSINNARKNVADSVAKSASQLKENQTIKRTISSIRIPLKTNTSSTGINTGDVTQTGLNIPI